MPISADSASWPVFRLRMAMPRANSWMMVVDVKAQKPKQMTAGPRRCRRPAAKQTTIVTSRRQPAAR